MSINSSMLRLTWAAIEETPSHELLTLTDTALVKLILQQITQKILLTGEEVCALHGYLGSKTRLIRDIAESRLAQATRLANITNQHYLQPAVEPAKVE